MAAEVSLKIGAFIENLEKGLNQAKGKLAQFTSFVQKNQAKLKKARLGAGAVLAGGILIMRDLTKAYAVQEQAEVGLAQAMKNAGIYTKEAFERTKEYASALQKLTTFGDEEIIQAQALLVAVGKLSGEGLERATKATLDLAAAKKMDLRSAADLVSKSIGTSMNALSRYGVEIDNAATGTERAAAVTEGISKLFAGQAAAAAGTMTGQLKQLSNAWGDIREDLGEAILPMIVKFAGKVQSTLPIISKFVKEHQTFLAVLAGGGVGGAGLVVILSQFALMFANPATGWIAGIGFAALAIAGLVAWLKDLGKELLTVPDSIAGIDESIEMYEKKFKDSHEKLKMLKDLPADQWELTTAADIEMLEKAALQYLHFINDLKKARYQMVKAMYPEDVETSEAVDQPIGVEDMAIPGIPTEEDIENMESSFEMVRELMQEHYDTMADMGETESQRIKDIEADKMLYLEQLYEYALQNMLIIWATAFSGLDQIMKQYNAGMLVAAMDGMINMLKMIIDIGINEIMADQIKWTARLAMMGAFDWSAIAKIAMVGAAAGVAKAGLSALLGKAKGSLAKSVPKYEYGGVVPETGLALVHQGEHIFNPAYPMESMRNMGGGFTYNHYGNLNTKRDIYDSLLDFEERMFSRRLAGGMGR